MLFKTGEIGHIASAIMKCAGYGKSIDFKIHEDEKLLEENWLAATAGYFSLRGIKVDEFLNMSKTDQLFYHAVKEAEEKRRAKELKSIMQALAKMHGAKMKVG